MKIDREIAIKTALVLLNEVGVEGMTLRVLAERLKVQAAALYWHFADKEELMDSMATRVLALGAKGMVPARASVDWRVWARAYGNGLRRTLLKYRDGARMVAGTRLQDTEYMKTAERVGSQLVQSGFTVREAATLMITIYDFTLSSVMEEQSMRPRKGEKAAKYDLAARSARLKEFPMMQKSGRILFGDFSRRYKDGLELIVRGAEKAGAE